MNRSTLICTLGGQPQIVTFALDYLLARAEEVVDVFVFHLSPPDDRVNHSLTRLLVEFDDNRYRGRPCRFRAIPLRHRDQTLPAIRTGAEADAVRQAVFSVVTELKQAGRTLHLCIAGGPRMMGLMALSAAMLHCGHQDKVWHIYTEPDFLDQAQQGAIMHDETGAQVQLVQVPVVPWGAYLPPFFTADRNPNTIGQAQINWMDQAEQKRCRQVWDALTKRERDVLQAFADGLNIQEVVERLVITDKTVSSHNTKILAQCKIFWNLSEETRLTYHFLRDKFKIFFSTI